MFNAMKSCSSYIKEKDSAQNYVRSDPILYNNGI